METSYYAWHSVAFVGLFLIGLLTGAILVGAGVLIGQRSKGGAQ